MNRILIDIENSASLSLAILRKTRKEFFFEVALRSSGTITNDLIEIGQNKVLGAANFENQNLEIEKTKIQKP